MPVAVVDHVIVVVAAKAEPIARTQSVPSATDVRRIVFFIDKIE
jgi:uncharacterized protein (DUF2384 family)